MHTPQFLVGKGRQEARELLLYQSDVRVYFSAKAPYHLKTRVFSNLRSISLSVLLFCRNTVYCPRTTYKDYIYCQILTLIFFYNVSLGTVKCVVFIVMLVQFYTCFRLEKQIRSENGPPNCTGTIHQVLSKHSHLRSYTVDCVHVYAYVHIPYIPVF